MQERVDKIEFQCSLLRTYELVILLPLSFIVSKNKTFSMRKCFYALTLGKMVWVTFICTRMLNRCNPCTGLQLQRPSFFYARLPKLVSVLFTSWGFSFQKNLHTLSPNVNVEQNSYLYLALNTSTVDVCGFCTFSFLSSFKGLRLTRQKRQFFYKKSFCYDQTFQ